MQGDKQTLNNPCRHATVAQFLAGYAQHLRSLGYAETSATHLEFSKYGQLMRQLHAATVSCCQTMTATDPVSYMPLLRRLRDLTVLSHMWESAVRSDNARRLAPQELQDRHGQPLRAAQAWHRSC